jgi:hypothetical protein
MRLMAHESWILAPGSSALTAGEYSLLNDHILICYELLRRQVDYPVRKRNALLWPNRKYNICG